MIPLTAKHCIPRQTVAIVQAISIELPCHLLASIQSVLVVLGLLLARLSSHGGKSVPGAEQGKLIGALRGHSKYSWVHFFLQALATHESLRAHCIANRQCRSTASKAGHSLGRHQGRR